MIFPSSNSIPESTLEKSFPLQASKWTTLTLLCDEIELSKLFESLGEFFLVSISGVSLEGREISTVEEFLANYKDYLSILKAGDFPDTNFVREVFTKGLSVSLDHFRKITLKDGRSLIRIVKPVIQIEPCFFLYSQTDQKFHEKAYSADSIPWGLQFSYPQLFQEPESKIIKKIFQDPEYPNGLLFKKIQHWIRNHSTPTPFQIGEKKINAPFRLGKNALPWLNEHPSLKSKGLKVIS